MGRKRFEYEIRGYEYAPESFRAFKGLPGQKMEQISLSGRTASENGLSLSDPRRQGGYGLCKAHRAGTGAKVPVLQNLWLFSQRRTAQVCVLPQPLVQGERYVQRDACVSCVSTGNIWPRPAGVSNRVRECEFDGNFRPVHVRKNYVVADLNRPLVVWLYAA